MKVLCITEDPDRPTIATFVGLAAAGVDVTVSCPPLPRARRELQAAGIPVVELDLRLRPGPLRALRRLLQQGGFDILHLFGNRAVQCGVLASRGLSVRIVAYRGIVGNLSFFDPMSWLRVLNPRIDRIVCVADAVRDFFLQMRPAFLRVPAARLVRIYKGHSLDWYTAQPADLRPLGIPEGAFVVACVANHRPRKGIELLVDAVGRLPPQWPVHLLLVGDMRSPALDRAIAASPAAQRIHRPGRRDDAPAITAASDLFVLPSIKREGLARSVIEAMCYARPVVVTACGGSPELVRDGESGLVVPVRDAGALAAAIERLYRDPALRERLGAAARERIRTHFRIEDTIAATLGLYRSLTDPAAPAGARADARG